MKMVTILSGKGGVGKSSVTASLALCFARSFDNNIACADCDVDASNLSLVFGADKPEEFKDLSTNKKAVFDYSLCTSCKRCTDICYFEAITWSDNKPALKPFSCEGCGLCKLACPSKAIDLIDVNNAKIGKSKTRYDFDIFFAQLNPGESGSGKVVSEVKKKAMSSGDYKVMLIDSAAGIGCPVIASVTGSDYAVLVTEPTPSGFSDLKKAYQVVSHFNIPCSIIINKFDLNKDYSEKISHFASKNDIDVIAKLPFDKSFAKALTIGKPIVEYDKTYLNQFEQVKKYLEDKLF